MEKERFEFLMDLAKKVNARELSLEEAGGKYALTPKEREDLYYWSYGFNYNTKDKYARIYWEVYPQMGHKDLMMDLVDLANRLDEVGETKTASRIDGMIKRASSERHKPS